MLKEEARPQGHNAAFCNNPIARALSSARDASSSAMLQLRFINNSNIPLGRSRSANRTKNNSSINLARLPSQVPLNRAATVPRRFRLRLSIIRREVSLLK